MLGLPAEPSSLKSEEPALASGTLTGAAAPQGEQTSAGGSSVELSATAASKTGAEPASAPRSPTVQSPSSEPTHFLLYLNDKTFVGAQGDALASEVSKALAAGLPVVLVHESDPSRGGCAFEVFFQTTPQKLIDGGLFNTLAEPFVSGEAHRKLSHALLAKKLGAEVGAGAASRLSFVLAERIRSIKSSKVDKSLNV